MSYDGNQRLTGVDMSQSGNTVAASTMTYDADSDLTNLTYTDGSDNTLAAYHFDYNAAGAVTDEYSRKDSDSTSLQSTYEAGDSNWAKTSYSYDADAQLTGATYSSNCVSAPTSFSAAYDPNGNRTSTGDTSARPTACSLTEPTITPMMPPEIARRSTKSPAAATTRSALSPARTPKLPTSRSIRGTTPTR